MCKPEICTYQNIFSVKFTPQSKVHIFAYSEHVFIPIYRLQRTLPVFFRLNVFNEVEISEVEHIPCVECTYCILYKLLVWVFAVYRNQGSDNVCIYSLPPKVFVRITKMVDAR